MHSIDFTKHDPELRLNWRGIFYKIALNINSNPTTSAIGNGGTGGGISINRTGIFFILLISNNRSVSPAMICNINSRYVK